MRILYLMTFVLVMFPVPTIAKDILSCQMDNGMHLRLMESQDVIEFEWNKPGETPAKVVIRQPIKQADFRFWNNQNEYLTYLLILRQDNYVYSLYASYDNWSGINSTGLTIEHDEVFLADHKCHYYSTNGNLADYVEGKLHPD